MRNKYMKRYYVNKNEQANGDHEVHVQDCSHFPDSENTYDLGLCSDCHEAVIKAKQVYPQSNGCYYCANECHTG